MPSTLANFTLGDNTDIQSDDFIVGYDTAVLGGERRWRLSTIANAVSGIMSTQLGNIFVEESSFTGTYQSLSASGYQKLPGGLIIQWGYSEDQPTTRNFPITFPTQCININATLSNDSYVTGDLISAWIVSSSQFRLRQGNVANPGTYMFWTALGY